LPGLIDAHSHVLLHPYNETSWEEQVLRESLGERVARATVHLRRTLEAGFTTLRDLGTEGAGYADVGLKQAIDKGVIPGPRLIVTTRAIVMKGSYAPKGFATELDIPQGAEDPLEVADSAGASGGKQASGGSGGSEMHESDGSSSKWQVRVAVEDEVIGSGTGNLRVSSGSVKRRSSCSGSEHR